MVVFADGVLAISGAAVPGDVIRRLKGKVRIKIDPIIAAGSKRKFLGMEY